MLTAAATTMPWATRQRHRGGSRVAALQMKGGGTAATPAERIDPAARRDGITTANANTAAM